MRAVLIYSIRTVAIFLAFIVSVGQAAAGQVVTDESRRWAREAVNRENTGDFQPEHNTVAVLYFQNRSMRKDLEPLQKGMALMLITDLAKIQEIRVVERVQLQALTEELKLGTTGLVSGDPAPRMGRLLGVRYIVGGDLGTLQQDNIKITSSLVDIPQTNLLGSPTSNGPLDAILKMEKELLFEIVRLLKLELTPAQIEELRKPITSNTAALGLLFQGIQSSDRGAFEEAAAHYGDVLKLDPNLKIARSALTELQQLRLITPRPGSEPLLRTMQKKVSVNSGPAPGPVTQRQFSSPISPQGPGGTTEVLIDWQ